MSEEIVEFGFSACVDEEDIVYVSHIEHAVFIDNRVDVCFFKFTHEYIGIGGSCNCAHSAAFGLKIIFIVKAKTIKGENMFHKGCYSFRVRDGGRSIIKGFF